MNDSDMANAIRASLVLRSHKGKAIIRSERRANYLGYDVGFFRLGEQV